MFFIQRHDLNYKEYQLIILVSAKNNGYKDKQGAYFLKNTLVMPDNDNEYYRCIKLEIS